MRMWTAWLNLSRLDASRDAIAGVEMPCSILVLRLAELEQELGALASAD
jgi:hypothetical protein